MKRGVGFESVLGMAGGAGVLHVQRCLLNQGKERRARIITEEEDVAVSMVLRI